MACALPWRGVAAAARVLSSSSRGPLVTWRMEVGGEGKCLSLVWYAFFFSFLSCSPPPIPGHNTVSSSPARSWHLAGSPVQGLSSLCPPSFYLWAAAAASSAYSLGRVARGDGRTRGSSGGTAHDVLVPPCPLLLPPPQPVRVIRLAVGSSSSTTAVSSAPRFVVAA